MRISSFTFLPFSQPLDPGGPGPASGEGLILEGGDFLLLETGDFLLLE